MHNSEFIIADAAKSGISAIIEYAQLLADWLLVLVGGVVKIEAVVET